MSPTRSAPVLCAMAEEVRDRARESAPIYECDLETLFAAIDALREESARLQVRLGDAVEALEPPAGDCLSRMAHQLIKRRARDEASIAAMTRPDFERAWATEVRMIRQRWEGVRCVFSEAARERDPRWCHTFEHAHLDVEWLCDLAEDRLPTDGALRWAEEP